MTNEYDEAIELAKIVLKEPDKHAYEPTLLLKLLVIQADRIAKLENHTHNHMASFSNVTREPNL